MYSDEFVAVVERVLATFEPPPVSRDTDFDAVVAEVVERVIAVYPHPRRRPLFGLRAIVDAYGVDSRYVVNARWLAAVYQSGLLRRARDYVAAA